MVSLDQMRRAMRLAVELRDFIPGTEAQCRHLMAGIGAMAGAYVTTWLELGGLPHEPVILRGYDHGWSDESARRHLLSYLSTEAHRGDPSARAINLAAHKGKVVTLARPQLVEDKTWYRSLQMNEYRRPAGLDDCIYSIVGGPKVTRLLTIHRPWKDRPFSEEERALVHALHTECAPLLDSPDVTAIGSLPPRLGQTLNGLVRGMGEKQLAGELSVSHHTLHGYVKELYRRLGVSSRAELHARFAHLIRPR